MSRVCKNESCNDLNHSGSDFCFWHDPTISTKSKDIMAKLKPVNEAYAFLSAELDRKPSRIPDEVRTGLHKIDKVLYPLQAKLSADFRASRKKDLACL